MSFAQSIKKKVIEPNDRQKFDLITGQVMTYDEETNTATVRYKDSKTGGLMTQERVPLELNGLGIVSSGPFPGDQVYLAFMNGNQLKPKVVATADESYATYTRPLTKHGRKGAFLTDYLSSVSSFIGGLFSKDEEAVQDDWIDDTSSSSNYQSYRQYSVNEFTKNGENWSYYRTAEVGLTHPLNSSTVKVRDNGVIDAFASTNCGVRIDPNSHSLNLISNKELHNSTNATFLVDRQMRLEAGRELYTKTPSVKVFSDKQQHESDSIIVKTERYRLTGEDTRIKSDELQVTSSKSELKLGDTSLELGEVSLKSEITKAIMEELSLSSSNLELISSSNVTIGAGDMFMNTTNLTIEGHIEANIDHLIERWMNKEFGKYFDRALGQRQIVKLLEK